MWTNLLSRMLYFGLLFAIRTPKACHPTTLSRVGSVKTAQCTDREPTTETRLVLSTIALGPRTEILESLRLLLSMYDVPALNAPTGEQLSSGEEGEAAP